MYTTYCLSWRAWTLLAYQAKQAMAMARAAGFMLSGIQRLVHLATVTHHNTVVEPGIEQQPQNAQLFHQLFSHLKVHFAGTARPGTVMASPSSAFFPLQGWLVETVTEPGRITCVRL
jgi:hypothetical protein